MRLRENITKVKKWRDTRILLLETSQQPSVRIESNPAGSQQESLFLFHSKR